MSHALQVAHSASIGLNEHTLTLWKASDCLDVSGKIWCEACGRSCEHVAAMPRKVCNFEPTLGQPYACMISSGLAATTQRPSWFSHDQEHRSNTFSFKPHNASSTRKIERISEACCSAEPGQSNLRLARPEAAPKRRSIDGSQTDRHSPVLWTIMSSIKKDKLKASLA